MGVDSVLTAEAPARPVAGGFPAPPPAPAPAPPSAPARPIAPPQTGAAGAPRVFTSIDVPLTLNGRFLGMISADVDIAGAGLVDGQRFMALIEPVVTPQTLVALRQAAAGRERIPFADLNIPGFQLEFLSTSLELSARAGRA